MLLIDVNLIKTGACYPIQGQCSNAISQAENYY